MGSNFVLMKTVLNFLNTKNMAVSCYDLPSDVTQFYFIYRQHPEAYDRETALLSSLIRMSGNIFEKYRKAESFISIAIQNSDLEYRVDLDDMCGLKLTKDYLNWCREHDEFVCLRTTQEYYQEKLEDSIPKELKPYYAMMKIYIVTKNIDRETLLKLLKIIKYTVCHLRADEAINDIEKLYELTHNLTDGNKSC